MNAFFAADAAAPSASLFREPDFRRLWLVGLVVFAVRWLETLVVAVVVYQRTGSAFLVAMMTMLRLLPMGLFGAFLGAAAERWERRTSLLLVLLSLLLSSLVLALLAYAGRLEVWHLGVVSFWNGVGWATDNPVRRMMIGEVAGPARMGRAMSFDIGANNASRMIGPMFGGLLLVSAGVTGAFALAAMLYGMALIAAFGLRLRNRPGSGGLSGEKLLARVMQGLEVVFHDRRLIGTLVVTVIFNVFGWPCLSMVPVIGRDAFGLAPGGVGVLSSLDGIGAFAGAVVVAMLARPRNYAPFYLGGIFFYLLGLFALAFAPGPYLAGACLLLAGIGGSGFSIMQATLVFLAAPAEMRSRVLGVLSVCIGIGPVGFLHVGLLAEWVGAQNAIAVSAAEGLAALALTWTYWRHILPVEASRKLVST